MKLIHFYGVAYNDLEFYQVHSSLHPWWNLRTKTFHVRSFPAASLSNVYEFAFYIGCKKDNFIGTTKLKRKNSHKFLRAFN